jgi:3'(2'), 5'-bisphosphate nucleotidase
VAKQQQTCTGTPYNTQDHGVEMKGDESPLTKADTESNRIICDGLQRVSPHVPIISEENKTLPYSIRKVT